MTTSNDAATPPGERELVITRTFDAPRELVWKAFTESDRLAQWWGPKGFTMVVRTLDVRRGGVFHYAMRSPSGQLVWGAFVFREIRPLERIVFISSFANEEGNIIRAPFSPTWPLEILNTVTLTESDGKTTVTFRGGPINATEEERDTFWNSQKSVQQGFAGTFDQLAAYLAGNAKGQ
ncbi:MAG TPA: SRPBCC domain-containing protein [Ktedonobacterales bacterium]|nr:SRPBCC domain-containing protein [Ktedonobacterales bacterium]